MKKIVWILLFIVLLNTKNVFASNYRLKELIPMKETTTITTERFLYRNIGYDKEKGITFSSVKNIFQEELPISISIGLFDKHKNNIGTINYCSSFDKLLPKEEKEYAISVEEYLSLKKEKTDISYFAILSDNRNCNRTDKDIYVGKTIEEIGKSKTTEITEDLSIFIKVLIVTLVLVIAPILYKVIFTSAYENVNGDAVRKDYNYYQENGLFKKEESQKEGKSKEEKVEKPKEEEKEEENETDLQKLYK